MRIKLSHLLVFAGLLAPALQAGDGFQISYGQVIGMDALKKVTNSGTGFILGAGFQGENEYLPWRLSANLNLFPGTERNGLKTSLTSFQVAADTFVQTPVNGLRLVTGISANKYSIKNTGEIYDGAGKLVKSFPVDNDKGIKIGLRVGFEYAITKQWSCEFLYQATELGATPTVVKTSGSSGLGYGAGAINPAWVQLGVRYSF